MNLLEAFGSVIRRERMKRRMTQERLAELADLHHNFISLVERGKTAAALDSIAALAEALDCRPSQLIRAAERDFAANRKA